MTDSKEILKELIRIPSYVDTKNHIDECKIGDYIYTFFKNLQKVDLTLNVEKQFVEKNRFNLLVYKGEPKILLGFHMDTVPPHAENWKITEPFKPKEMSNKLFGRGSIDMKSQVAVMMSLTEELLPRLNNFYFLFTVDEEYDFKGILVFLERINIKPSLIIFCEPTDLKISNMHRGIIQVRIAAYGKSAHAGTPKTGINAIELLTESLKEVGGEIMANKFSDSNLGLCSFNFAYISGGQEGSYNCVPNKAMAVLDIRPTPKLTKDILEKIIREKIRNKFKQKCQENNLDFGELFREPEINYDFIFGPLLTNKKDLEPLEKEVKQIIGGVEYTFSQGISEAGILSEKLKVPACNFGPGPKDLAHKPDEYVNLKDLKLFKDVLANLLLKIS